jgi:hypothetical protein
VMLHKLNCPSSRRRIGVSITSVCYPDSFWHQQDWVLGEGDKVFLGTISSSLHVMHQALRKRMVQRECEGSSVWLLHIEELVKGIVWWTSLLMFGRGTRLQKKDTVLLSVMMSLGDVWHLIQIPRELLLSEHAHVLFLVT